jgi:hypothetical protein
MEKNKTGKYLKYALGEIVLVVIGILIALQINNWNQDRLNRKAEKETLINLKQDLGSAMDQLIIKIYQNDAYRHLDSTALSIIHNNEEISTDSIYGLLLPHIYTPTFDPELGTLTEILSTGKMEIIQNELLRNHISSWNKFMDELSEVDNRLIYLDDNFKAPLYMKILPYRNSLNRIINPNTTDPLIKPISKSNFQTSVRESFYSLEFENMLSNYLIYGLIQRERLGDIENKITDMISIIERDLGHD